MRMIVGALLAATLATAAAAQLPQSERQKYDYWLRCVAMMQIKGREAGTARDDSAAGTLKDQTQRARDNLMKEAMDLGMAPADVEKNTRDRVAQFASMLAQGNKETDALFERAVEICGASLQP